MMRNNRKTLTVFVLVVLLIASFLAGSYLEELENRQERAERCGTLILFAIDKVENGDLNDPGTMKALISNVYAAYQLCDDSIPANQLHDLWNYLIFESDDNLEAAKEIALIELNDVLRAIRSE